MMSRIGGWQHRHAVLSLAFFAYFDIRFVEFVLSIVFKGIKTTLGISTFVSSVFIEQNGVGADFWSDLTNFCRLLS